MNRYQTQVWVDGDLRLLEGCPEDHGLTASCSYSFERDNDLWTVFLADAAPAEREAEAETLSTSQGVASAASLPEAGQRSHENQPARTNGKPDLKLNLEQKRNHKPEQKRKQLARPERKSGLNRPYRLLASDLVETSI